MLKTSGPAQKGNSSRGKEWHADTGGQSAIDGVAMGTSVSSQMKGDRCCHASNC